MFQKEFKKHFLGRQKMVLSKDAYFSKCLEISILDKKKDGY